MLESIEKYIYNSNVKINTDIKQFLLLYKKDIGCKIFNEDKLFNMLRHFEIVKNSDMNNISDYGKFIKDNKDKFIEYENQRQHHYGNNNLGVPFIENPIYLIATYNRLKRTIQTRTQYIILKDAILCLSPIDTEHFINILLRKYTSDQINQIINIIEKNLK